ncbi:Gryzun, putative trafficking through golgi-domain-containing protein [Ganoderma leucocontextum]|nr:Gryzun, putative trafficking through golgi-domain-containing protein [Ganoderma leucocontextum]
MIRIKCLLLPWGDKLTWSSSRRPHPNMNSYPPELLVQLAPVMFVAGLDARPPQPTIPASGAADSPTNAPTQPRQDAFYTLAMRLRDALLAQRKVAIWQPEKAKTFQVVLVDKDAPFPPRKMLRPEEPQYSSSHSPLSPLTQSSPLYPDGLIAPIWIRKHTTLVPSVFVVFMRIYESPLPPSGQEQDPKEREAEERKRDTELAAEIAQRKKSTNERNIKLTAVLMASRRMLDDPTLDARLTFIRRQSGLDPRAALFVLSPVSQAEIGDFVRSLQEALYEPALEYYTNHSKRVRRKRNRHSQASSYQIPITPLVSTGIARPLRPEGWTVRYEYKMACFAEFRGEDQVALKHYQDAYSTLLIMFGSTAILPPRTKRWAEAKVLADCINVKIVKLYLYNNEHALALSNQNSHMRKFADFSRGWGIGEETFEFWSWLARQHRVFAELLEQGTRTTLKIPSAYPPQGPSAAAVAAQALEASQVGLDAMRVLGLNPNQALQHPGFYHYMAARCTERRRERFLSAQEDAEGQQTSSPGFVNEKKVDHLTIVLELYTRAYELFKKWSPQQNNNPGRLTLWIAYRIAQTYYDSGKFDMAVRFFERIARTYRRESWESLLHPLLSQWYKCAQQLGYVDLSVRLLVEMLGYGASASAEDADALQDDLLAVLQSTVPSATDEPLVVDLSESRPPLKASVVFWEPEVDVGVLAPFQILLSSLPHVSLSSIPFTSLAVHFHGDIPAVVVKHVQTDPDAEVPSLQRFDLGDIAVSPAAAEPREIEGVLRWGPASTIVFTGSVSSDLPMRVSVAKLVLTIRERNWWIEVPILPEASRPDRTLTAPKWLCSVDPPQYVPMRREDHTGVRVHYSSHRVQVLLSHNGPAYIGEEFPIEINVTNNDDKELDIVVDVLLQPTEIDEAVNYIAMDDQRSSSLIKGVACGTLLPGVSVLKKLYLTNLGDANERVIDISVQSEAHAPSTAAPTTTPASPTSPTSPTAPLVDRTETLRTIAITAIQPFKVAHTATYRRPTRPQPGLADLETFGGGKRDEASAVEAVVTSTLTVAAPSGIVIDSMMLQRKDNNIASVVDCSVDEEDFSGEWLSGDELCDRCRISVVPDEEDPDQPIPGPGEYEVRWRRVLPDGGHGTEAMTPFSLPPLRPPSDGLVALLDAPTTARLHTAIPLRLTIRNRHPTRSANVTVQLEPEGSEAFVVAGLRHGRMPILLPGAEESVTWNLIPIECGLVRVPNIKVLDRRSAVQIAQQQSEQGQPEGDEVGIIDVRWESRQEEGEVPVSTARMGRASDAYVLVLP